MYAVVSLIVILTLSMLTVRVGTLALMLTGMSKDVARFQALSAFTGAGFTTQEAEDVISYPARRRVIQNLIRLGNVGVITSIASIVLSFMEEQVSPLTIVLVLVVSIGLLGLSRSKWFNQLVNPLIKKALRQSSSFELRDYSGLLEVENGHQVADIKVQDGEWLANEPLAELRLHEHEGVLILGIRRADGTYVEAPSGEDIVYPGDTVIAYGKTEQLQDLAERSKDGLDVAGFNAFRTMGMQEQFFPWKDDD